MVKGKGNAIPLPDVDLCGVTDYYTWFVDIAGVPEDVFWTCDIAFVKTVAANKQAFNKWMNRQQELNHGKKRSKN